MDNELEEMSSELAEVLAGLMVSKVSDNPILEYEEEIKCYFLEKHEKVLNFRKSLSNESDRGCALFSASFLEYELENLLKKYLLEDISVSKNVFAFNGSLGTFSSKIDMAYLLGIVGKKTHKDLHLIRKIRNEFGHNHVFISFESEKIKNMCRELYYNTLNFEVSSRTNFTRVVCGVLGIIIASEINIKRVNSVIDLEITDKLKENNTKFLKNILDLNIRDK